MKKIIIVIAVIGGVYYYLSNTKKNEVKFDPINDGYVPNEETAIKIAETIWLPIYGENILKKKPFKASLKNNEIWTVEGTSSTPKGGVPYIEIQKKDCKILYVYHTK